MTESLGIAPESFRTAFDSAYETARHEQRPYYAWISTDYAWTTTESPWHPHTIWQVAGVAPNSAGDKSTITYNRWQISSPDPPTQVSEQNRRLASGYLGAPPHPEDYMPHSPHTGDGVLARIRRLDVPLVFSTLVSSAPDRDQLLYVTGKALDWIRNEEVPLKGSVRPIIGAIMLRGLQVLPSLYDTQSSPFLDALAPLPDEQYGITLMREGAGRFLGHMLTRNFRGSTLKPDAATLDTIDPDQVTQAVREAEKRSILPSNFWLEFGLQHDAIFTNPNVLANVHDRLTQPDRNILAEAGIEPIHRQHFVRTYVQSMLDVLKNDPNRDQRRLRSIDTFLGRLQKDAEVLGAINAFANGITPELNARFMDRNIDITLPPLDIRHLQSVPTALMRILCFTVHPDTDPAVLSRMYTCDVMHTEVIDRIQTLLHETPEHPSPADLRLRRAQTQELHTTIATPIRPKSEGDARLDIRFSRRPGYGLLS